MEMGQLCIYQLNNDFRAGEFAVNFKNSTDVGGGVWRVDVAVNYYTPLVSRISNYNAVSLSLIQYHYCTVSDYLYTYINTTGFYLNIYHTYGQIDTDTYFRYIAVGWI